MLPLLIYIFLTIINGFSRQCKGISSYHWFIWGGLCTIRSGEKKFSKLVS